MLPLLVEVTWSAVQLREPRLGIFQRQEVHVSVLPDGQQQLVTLSRGVRAPETLVDFAEPEVGTEPVLLPFVAERSLRDQVLVLLDGVLQAPGGDVCCGE